jgi:hypothetical protein
MRDRNLEKNIDRVEAFVERWKQLSVYLDRGFRGENFGDEEEAAFLELKSRIVQEYELLMTTLAGETDRDERPLRLLSAVPSLQSFRELPEGMARKLATDWHSTFLGLQALLGRLRGRQAQLAGISTLRVGLKRVFGNPLVIMLVMVAAAYGVYRFAYDWIPRLKELMEK